jgi:UDP-glucose:(heptosyl)LPS alpha-1,3-glucosyltransferase
MTTIVQITPEIGPGTGVGAVAHHLEAQWQGLGLDVRRFTLADAGGSWLPRAGGGVAGRLSLLARVVWFSTVGTRRARRLLDAHPDYLSVCHNDALAGDLYVNHGIVQAAMRARGHYWLRMARNPVHAFTSVRDRWRYEHPSTHRLVVNLVSDEERVLRDTYPGLRIPTVVIGNGVDVERFQPPTPSEREAARAALGLAATDRAVLFIGNEFGRKGLSTLVEAVSRLGPEVHLFVVGGTPEMVAAAATSGAAPRLGGRLHLAGAHPDPRPWLHAADVLAMPSAYESFGLVVLEALACGVPVVASPTGCVPDVIVDGTNGAVVAPLPDPLAEGLRRVLASDPGAMRAAARRTAEQHSWAAVAGRYLEVLTGLRERSAATPGGVAS